MINLFEHYSQEAWDLHYSIFSSGFQHPTIVLNDDGFLPKDVTSPIQYYTGFLEQIGKPLFFNELSIPEYWEIKSTSHSASVWEFDRKRADIHFVEGNPYRQIKEVDWLNQEGKLLAKDYYNSSGYRFAQSSYHEKSNQKRATTYFNKKNQEVLFENHITGDILLNQGKHILMFKSKVEFIVHYLQEANFNTDRIFYNSLGLPFLVALNLTKTGNDILFWQEPIYEDLPGNMKVLLNTHNRATQIIVQEKEAFEKIMRLASPEQKTKISFAGYKYPFKRENLGRLNALILTNSDQIVHLEEIVQKNPQLNIYIGALTEMSSSLMSMDRYKNVRLYPNISSNIVEHLFNTCDIYLDINLGTEILSATREAFLNNMLVLSFDNTTHNMKYVAQDNIFNHTTPYTMLETLEKITQDPQYIIKHNIKQRASVETTAKYKDTIG